MRQKVKAGPSLLTFSSSNILQGEQEKGNNDTIKRSSAARAHLHVIVEKLLSHVISETLVMLTTQLFKVQVPGSGASRVLMMDLCKLQCGDEQFTWLGNYHTTKQHRIEIIYRYSLI